MPRIVRVDTVAEFVRLHELLLAYEAGLEPALRHGDVPPLEGVTRAYAAPNAAFLALSGGESVGCVVVRRLDAETAVLARLFVRPQHRGAGIARALVERVVDFARDADFARVVLDTDKDKLPAAYRLYLSFGFSECEPYETVDYGCPTFMQLPLSAERRLP